MATPAEDRTILTVRQFCEQNPAFSEGALRWMLFHRKANGLHKAIIKCGRRVLIDRPKFFQWLDSQRECGEN